MVSGEHSFETLFSYFQDLTPVTYTLDMLLSAYNVGNMGSIPGSGRSPREGNGTPLQYSCLENPMDGGAWQATVHGVAKRGTRLNDFTFTFKSVDIIPPIPKVLSIYSKNFSSMFFRLDNTTFPCTYTLSS